MRVFRRHGVFQDASGNEETIPLNNNRNNNNNRRRGRGNRNQGGGGGNQANRIDSRARGNAPQLLDKYKKLAQDAQHNGDRVQAEYYLQFADHYFRVLAYNRSRQDEQRGRRDDRDSDYDEDDGEDEGEDRRRISAGHSGNQGNQGNRQRNRRDEQRGRPEQGDGADAREGDDGSEGEDGDNPFAYAADRDDSPRRAAPRNRRDHDARDEGDEGRGKADQPKPARRAAKPRPRKSESEGGGIDAAVLPPSIGANDAEAAAKPAKPRRRRSADDDSPLTAVG